MASRQNYIISAAVEFNAVADGLVHVDEDAEIALRAEAALDLLVGLLADEVDVVAGHAG